MQLACLFEAIGNNIDFLVLYCDDQPVVSGQRLGATVRDPFDSPREALRAYETTNVSRAASILRDITDLSTATTSRRELIRIWAERHPRHADQSRFQSSTIISRVSKALSLMKSVKIVSVEGDVITIINREHLEICARNLAILQDDNGVAIPPRRWKHRPEVPSNLAMIRNSLEFGRLAAFRAANCDST